MDPNNPQPIPPHPDNLITYSYDASALNMVRLLNRKNAGEFIYGDKCRDVDVFSAPPWTYIPEDAEPVSVESGEHIFRSAHNWTGNSDVKRSLDGEASTMQWKRNHSKKNLHDFSPGAEADDEDGLVGYRSFLHLEYKSKSVKFNTCYYMEEIESDAGDQTNSICKIRLESEVLVRARRDVMKLKNKLNLGTIGPEARGLLEEQYLIIRNELARIREANLQAFEQHKFRDPALALPVPAPALALPAPPAALVVNDEGHLDPLMGGDMQDFDDLPVVPVVGWYVRTDPDVGVTHVFVDEGDEIPVGAVLDPDFDGGI